MKLHEHHTVMGIHSIRCTINGAEFWWDPDEGILPSQYEYGFREMSLSEEESTEAKAAIMYRLVFG